MANDFQGSLAQTGISFNTTITYSSVTGDNFYKVGLFIESVTDAVANLGSAYRTLNTPTTVTASNYTTIVTANSVLYNWLVNYFGLNASGTVYICVYNGTTHDIATAYTAMSTLAYFKMVFFGSTESLAYKNDVVSLAGQCYGNSSLSQLIVGSSDTNLAILASGGSNVISDMIIASGYDAMVSYSAVTSYNPMLSAIGYAISYLNSTGTPVGNNLDFTSTGSILPSTGTVNTNISSVQVSNLQNRKVGYFETVGDGTGSVFLNNRLTLTGRIASADWLVRYTNYVCSVTSAQMITKANGKSFKNNDFYQQILAMINGVISPFQTRLGRLTNFTMTAPAFSNLPVTGGTVFTIPNAWSATYNDRIDTITVGGSLYTAL